MLAREQGVPLKGYGRRDEGASRETLDQALGEAEAAAQRVLAGEFSVQLHPQRAYVRRLQHLLAERFSLASTSRGREPERCVLIYRARRNGNRPLRRWVTLGVHHFPGYAHPTKGWPVAGLFITFEGGDGSGKTTQSLLLAERLAELSIPHLLVREPGGTELSEYLRDYLKSDRPISPQSELLVFAAARADLVGFHILPALESGQVVVADRFFDSTVAYQGYGRGMDLEVIRLLNRFAPRKPAPT